MGNNNFNFTIKNIPLLDSFKRQGKFPIDADSIFENANELNAYLASDRCYDGQIITYKDNNKWLVCVIEKENNTYKSTPLFTEESLNSAITTTATAIANEIVAAAVNTAKQELTEDYTAADIIVRNSFQGEITELGRSLADLSTRVDGLGSLDPEAIAELVNIDLSDYLTSNLGSQNAGKYLSVDDEGNIITVELIIPESSGGNPDLTNYATKEWVNGKLHSHKFPDTWPTSLEQRGLGNSSVNRYPEFINPTDNNGQPLPSGMTTLDFLKIIKNSFEEGNIYIGSLYTNDMPFNGNAEVVIIPFRSYLAYLNLYSANVSPYRWFGTYFNNSFSGWTAINENSGSGSSDIQLKTINGESLKGTGNISVLTQHQDISGKADADSVYTKEEVNTLLNGYADSSYESKVDTLIGSDTGKSVSQIVSGQIAEVIADAPSSYDTLKEISDWISSHSSSAATMNSAINENTGRISTLETNVDTLKDTTVPGIANRVSTLENSNTTNTGKISTLEGKVDTLETTTIPGLAGRISVLEADSSSGSGGGTTSQRQALNNFDFLEQPSAFGDFYVRNAINSPFGSDVDGLLSVMQTTDGILETWTSKNYTGYRILKQVNPIVAGINQVTVNGVAVDTSILTEDLSIIDENHPENKVGIIDTVTYGTKTVRTLVLAAGGEYELSGALTNVRITIGLPNDKYAIYSQCKKEKTYTAAGKKVSNNLSKRENQLLYLEAIGCDETTITLNNLYIHFNDYVATDDEETALDNVNSSEPIIFSNYPGNLFIELADNSQNYLKRSLQNDMISVNAKAGVIYSEGPNVIINGNGYLGIYTLLGGHAIKSKYGLQIGSNDFSDTPHISATAYHDILHGNEYLYIYNGYIQDVYSNDCLGTDTSVGDQNIGKIRVYNGYFDLVDCSGTFLQADNAIVYPSVVISYKHVGEGLWLQADEGILLTFAGTGLVEGYTSVNYTTKEFVYKTFTTKYAFSYIKGILDDNGDITDDSLYPGTIEASDDNLIGIIVFNGVSLIPDTNNLDYRESIRNTCMLNDTASNVDSCKDEILFIPIRVFEYTEVPATWATSDYSDEIEPTGSALDPLDAHFDSITGVYSGTIYGGNWNIGLTQKTFADYGTEVNYEFSNISTMIVPPKQINLIDVQVLNSDGTFNSMPISYLHTGDDVTIRSVKIKDGNYIYGTKSGLELTINMRPGDIIRIHAHIDPDNVTNNQLKWTVVGEQDYTVIGRVKEDNLDYCQVTALQEGTESIVISTKALTKNYTGLSTKIHFNVDASLSHITDDRNVQYDNDDYVAPVDPSSGYTLTESMYDYLESMLLPKSEVEIIIYDEDNDTEQYISAFQYDEKTDLYDSWLEKGKIYSVIGISHKETNIENILYGEDMKFRFCEVGNWQPIDQQFTITIPASINEWSDYYFDEPIETINGLNIAPVVPTGLDIGLELSSSNFPTTDYLYNAVIDGFNMQEDISDIILNNDFLEYDNLSYMAYGTYIMYQSGERFVIFTPIEDNATILQLIGDNYWVPVKTEYLGYTTLLQQNGAERQYYIFATDIFRNNGEAIYKLRSGYGDQGPLTEEDKEFELVEIEDDDPGEMEE